MPRKIESGMISRFGVWTTVGIMMSLSKREKTKVRPEFTISKRT